MMAGVAAITSLIFSPRLTKAQDFSLPEVEDAELSLLQSRIDAMAGAGEVVLDRMYRIRGKALTIHNPGITITARTPTSGITQMTFGLPAIDVRASDTHVNGGTYTCAAPKELLRGRSGPLRLPTREYAAGIFCLNSSNCRIQPGVVENFVVGVRMAGNVGPVGRNAKGNVVSGAVFRGCDFGVLANGQEDFLIRSISGERTDRSQGLDPHLIYFSARAQTPTSSNVVIEDVRDVDNIYSGSIKINKVSNSKIRNIYAKRIARGSDMWLCEGLEVSNAHFTEIIAPPRRDTQQAGMGFDECTRVHVRDSTIALSNGVNCSGIFISSATKDCTFSNVKISVRYDSRHGNHAPVRVSGAGNERIHFNSMNFDMKGVANTAMRLQKVDQAKITDPQVFSEHPAPIFFRFGNDSRGVELHYSGLSIQSPMGKISVSVEDRGIGNMTIRVQD
ncbi:hypothetical protein [Roseomonas xinghualingensis]|uniref:hypothetical protein n=1 Tax=Roseomonas xinghualingensis TaxID=2986475 RepID=UPI0021F154E5|nr:hypothetical protein [Roseomonas sp. SXEYE001]MCV4208669.1 hypothetical protein [Roseomonas sp. SXEYE001]